MSSLESGDVFPNERCYHVTEKLSFITVTWPNKHYCKVSHRNVRPSKFVLNATTKLLLILGTFFFPQYKLELKVLKKGEIVNVAPLSV